MPHPLSSPRTYVPAIDGLRAVAAMAVMLCHTRYFYLGTPVFSLAHLGWTGVDLFFVISGFLITRILLDLRGSGDYYKRFYLRRIARIWPLYFAVLAGCAVFYRLDPAVKWWAYPFFIQNLVITSFGPEIIGPTWSLAVEEQFYLIWPFCVSLFRPRVLAMTACIAFAGTLAIRFIVHGASGSLFYPYVNTLCRLDGLALGALLATALYLNISPRILRIASACVLVAGALGASQTVALYNDDRQPVMLTYSFLALMFAGLVGLCVLGAMPFQRILELRPLRSIGRVSYGLYLLHVGAFAAARSMLPRSRYNPWFVLLVSYLLAFAAAGLSWWLLEKRVLKAVPSSPPPPDRESAEPQAEPVRASRSVESAEAEELVQISSSLEPEIQGR